MQYYIVSIAELSYMSLHNIVSNESVQHASSVSTRLWCPVSQSQDDDIPCITEGTHSSASHNNKQYMEHNPDNLYEV